jgi:Ni,Fe-hydrogenase III small subunit/NAD-dependent dihydropyrimidine dehydrogenase PreA subunit
LKEGLFNKVINNIVTLGRSPAESIEVLFGKVQKMPFAGPRCDACGGCSKACLTKAIEVNEEWAIDIGKCIFCGDCLRACEKGAISMEDSPDYALARGDLVFRKNSLLTRNRDRIDQKKLGVFGKSLSIRFIDAGSCNGCEVETSSLSNQFYDIERFGIKIVPSPRHADVLLITGPLTKNMYLALTKAVAATPDPKVIIAMGTCAISGGLFSKGEVMGEGIGDVVKVDMYIPGCPPSPDKIIRALLTAFDMLTEQR